MVKFLCEYIMLLIIIIIYAYSNQKTFFFGFAIGLVGCFKGYYCKKGTAGVGLAANSAVVYTSMLLFIIDFIAVFVTDIFYDL